MTVTDISHTANRTDRGAAMTQTNGTSEILDELKKDIAHLRPRLAEIARSIHERPELRFNETYASSVLADELDSAGFSVERGSADLPTAFVADHRNGEGPTIGVFCEYDALEGLGHGCGHNLIAAAGLGAGLLTKRWLDAHPEVTGQVRVLGSPAEEGGGGKVFLERAGYLEGLDAAMMIHPGGVNQPWITTFGRAVLSVTFTGKAAHAAGAPYDGINALDAATLALNALGLLRQQLRPDSRVHAIVTEGGQASNVIPDRASLLMQVRSTSMEYLADRLLPAVENCMQGAALATGTTVEITHTSPLYEPILNNPVLVAQCADNMRALELDVEPSPPPYISFSTDMGNVSQRVPSLHPTLMLEPGLGLHTIEAAAAAGAPAAAELVSDGALLLATLTIQLLTSPNLRTDVRAEFDRARATSAELPDQRNSQTCP